MTKIMENKLNMVTGGDFAQSGFDSRVLHSAGYMDEDRDTFDLMFHWNKESPKVDAGWAKAGITCVTCPFGNNRYYMNNKRIARCVAMKTIGYPYPF